MAQGPEKVQQGALKPNYTRLIGHDSAQIGTYQVSPAIYYSLIHSLV
jgi:hypothetical protein